MEGHFPVSIYRTLFSIFPLNQYDLSPGSRKLVSIAVRMRKFVILAAFFLLPILVLGQIGQIEKAPCFLADCSPANSFPNVEFGYLTVPEDYGAPEGRQLRVAFSVIKSTSGSAKPDPLLVFQGGWGLPIVQATFGYARNFPFRDRDIILFDYRGSGFSQPSLCPELGQEFWDLIETDLDYDKFSDRISSLSYDCLDEIESLGFDYRQFGTAVKTRDAVVLAEALGYDEVNLFGISNGTMGIQGFLRAAEGSPVRIRSILSDSNVPMGVYTNGKIAEYYRRALDSVLADCANDPECAAAYPDLGDRFDAFLEETADAPLIYPGPPEVTLNRYEINSIVHQLLYNKSNYKDIPLLLEAFMSRDLVFFDQLSDYFRSRVSELNGTSVINFAYDWNAGKDEIRKDYMQNLDENGNYRPTDFWLKFMVIDSVLGYHGADTIPVTSDAPALVLAGGYDPITPPGLSEIMHNRYAGSFYFELPRVGHGAVIDPCGQALYTQFLAEPGQLPGHPCLEELGKSKIPFSTAVYHNQHMAKLGGVLFPNPNIWWAVAIALILVISLVEVIRSLVRLLRRKAIVRRHFLLALLMLVFFASLGYFLMDAIGRGGLFLLFGLDGAAAFLPWLALAILLGGILDVVILFRNPRFKFATIAIPIAVGLTLVTAFSFGLFPF